MIHFEDNYTAIHFQPAHHHYLAGSVLGGLGGKLPTIWGINGKKQQKVWGKNRNQKIIHPSGGYLVNFVPLHALKAVRMTRPGAVRPGMDASSPGIFYRFES